MASEVRIITKFVYRRFLAQDEYVKNFTDRGGTVPPFLVGQPSLVKDGVEGFMVPCTHGHPGAELWAMYPPRVAIDATEQDIKQTIEAEKSRR